MQADKAQNSSTGRRVVSPRPTKNNVAQQSKKNTSQQTRKISSPTRGVQPKKLRALKQPKTQAKPSVRQVIRSNKKAKLSITITGQTGKKKAQKQQKAANKVLLPGKVSQALAKKTSAAKKVVNRSKNRKVTPAKNIQVVRKVPGQRKKN
ncbi:hypothetical protein PHMEG_00030833 [Phytophthora megakarya]|uniref:Uncharacterized protein n=1 Tax=Phytophthora megakarya TaxID=4795 RepID=A0A225UZR0_9STRA|nr:hypothetical protein PHMEG_00030833 [Phytophthora megakarya]